MWCWAAGSLVEKREKEVGSSSLPPLPLQSRATCSHASTTQISTKPSKLGVGRTRLIQPTLTDLPRSEWFLCLVSRVRVEIPQTWLVRVGLWVQLLKRGGYPTRPITKGTKNPRFLSSSPSLHLLSFYLAAHPFSPKAQVPLHLLLLLLLLLQTTLIQRIW